MTFILYFPFQICVIHSPRVKGFDRSAGRVLSCLIIESNDRISTTLAEILDSLILEIGLSQCTMSVNETSWQQQIYMLQMFVDIDISIRAVQLV